MNRFLKIGSIILLLLCRISAYNLTDLIDSAFLHSGFVQNADIMMEKNRNEYKEIRSELFPEINLFANGRHYSQTYDPYQFEPGTPSYTAQYIYESWLHDPKDLVITNMLDSYSADRSFAPKKGSVELGVSIEQPIFQQGKVFTQLRMNKVVGSVLVCHWQDMRMQVKAAVTRHFYSLLLAREKVRVMNGYVSLNEKKREIVLSLYSSGEVLSLDTLSSFLDIIQAEEQLFGIEQNESLAELSLKRLIGADSLDTLPVEGELLPLEYSVSYDSAVALVVDQNKIITHLRGEQDLAALNTEMEKREYFPEVFAGINLSRLSHFEDRSNFLLEPERQIYLSVRYPLFTSGKRHFSVLQAEQQEEIVDNDLDETIKSLLNDLKKRWQEKNAEELRMERNRAARRVAEEAYSIATLQFSNGDLSLIEYGEYEQRLLSANLNYIESVYRFNCVIIELRLLTADYLYN